MFAGLDEDELTEKAEEAEEASDIATLVAILEQTCTNASELEVPAEAACDGLLRLTKGRPSQLGADGASACAAVCRALAAFAAEPGIVEVILGCVNNFAADAACREKLGACAIAELLVAVMGDHTEGEATLQEQGCLAIASLANDSAANVARLLAAGAEVSLETAKGLIGERATVKGYVTQAQAALVCVTKAAAKTTTLIVGTAQLAIDPSRSTADNLARIVAFVAEAGARGVELVVFPEAALTTYTPSLIEELLSTDSGREVLAQMERAVCDAARDHGVAVVIGMPFYDAATRCAYNSAAVIDAAGRIIGRHHKLQLVPPDESWSVAGTAIQTFRVKEGVEIGVVICHDTRYPELTRLPVLAGARLICYISCEQWHDDLPLVQGVRGGEGGSGEPWSDARLAQERGVYLAQNQARAVENRVWLVKANVPRVPATCADKTLGSHGQSCVIDATGMVRAMASADDAEELVVATVDLASATALYATKSLHDTFALSEWWRDAAVKVVRRE